MLIMLYVMQACYDDNSSLADQPIIEVGINSGTRDSIDIYFNDTLKINPELEISRSTELTYQWSMGVFKADSTTVYKEISTEKDLKYIVRELGHFHLRQVVTSEDGSTIRYYHVFVNSPFEEGFTILGRRPDGKGSLAFMKTLTKNEEASGMRPEFIQNAFVFANEGKELYLDPVDCDKVEQSLYILHGEGQKLVQIDAKTFKVLMEYDFRYYDANFIPTRLMCYDGRFSREFYVPSKNGVWHKCKPWNSIYFLILIYPRKRVLYIQMQMIVRVIFLVVVKCISGLHREKKGMWYVLAGRMQIGK